MFGLSGNDRLNGGVGNDLLNGGLGIDTADYSSGTVAGQSFIGATAGVTVKLAIGGTQNTGGAGSDRFVSIENLTGTTFNDTLIGNAANNELQGLAGNDILKGGTGNDILQGGSGNDTLDGGAGSDTADYSTATAGVTVDIVDSGEEPQDTGGAGIDTLVSIETLTGSNFNDDLDANFIEGSTLNGGQGNDTMGVAKSNNSTLNGEAGNDKLFARDCDAILNGGAGNDFLGSLSVLGGNTITMNGGSGADTLSDVFDDDITICVYHSVNDSPAGTGKDTIKGFTGHGSQSWDQIDLRDIDANTLVSGNQAFIFGGPHTAGHLWYSGGILNGNVDGDAAAEFQIHLVGTPTLSVGGAGSDILL